MLIVWLVFSFGLITQTSTTTTTTTALATNTTQAAITAAASTAESGISEGTSTDLENAETKDSNKLEIIKQIRRVNNDGSYTVGYEAVDGTFKIESRDVLGNVKGTYGYVDSNGEIKRVSYTANNATNGLKSTPAPVEEVVHIPRQNRTTFSASTATRRPASLAYLMSSTASPVRANSNVIQAIPKRRILLSSASTQTPHKNQFSTTARKTDFTTATTRKIEPTTTIVYATSIPQKAIRVTSKPSSTIAPIRQISKPDKVEITDRFSRVLNMNKARIADTKPLLESSEEKETQTERKPVRGNALRRQLPSEESENFEAQQQVVYSQSSDEDSAHNYGGYTGTPRTVFTTTSSPRIPALVLAARSRAALLKNTIHSAQTTSTTERVYSKPPRRKSEQRDNDETSTEPTSENSYITQSPVPVQIPPNRDASQASEDDQRYYRRPAAYLPRSRDYTRQSQTNPSEANGPRQYRLPVQVQQAYTQNDLDSEQYLRETTDPSTKSSTLATPEQYANNDPAAQPVSASYVPRATKPYLPQPASPNGYEQQLQQQQSFPIPIPPYGPPYRQPIGAAQYYNNPDRPLTARDFERLLNLLVLRHQQYQRYNFLPGLMNPFYGGFGAMGGYNPYLPFAYQQIPRPPIYNQFDPRYNPFNRALPPLPPPNGFYGPYSEQENMYQAQNPIPEQQIPYAGQRITPRRKAYNPQYFGAQGALYDGDESQQSIQQTNGEYLPSDVREELLYRMLMLAIQPDASSSAPIPDASTMQEYIKSSATATTPLPTKSKKPVRSVQILGEE